MTTVVEMSLQGAFKMICEHEGKINILENRITKLVADLDGYRQQHLNQPVVNHYHYPSSEPQYYRVKR